MFDAVAAVIFITTAMINYDYSFIAIQVQGLSTCFVRASSPISHSALRLRLSSRNGQHMEALSLVPQLSQPARLKLKKQKKNYE